MIQYSLNYRIIEAKIVATAATSESFSAKTGEISAADLPGELDGPRGATSRPAILSPS
jgi:hypothetical protein